MEHFLADTNALVRYAAGGRGLGRRAARAFENWESGKSTLHVPAPVVQETYLLWLGGRLRAPTTLAAWWRAIEGPTLMHEPLHARDILAASEPDWGHRDVYDRLVVAMAMRLGLPLLTSDGEIAGRRLVDVIW